MRVAFVKKIDSELKTLPKEDQMSNWNKEDRKRSVTIFLLFLTVLSVFFWTTTDAQNRNIPEWPRLNSEHKPATYWWWMGNAVNKKDLKFCLEKYAEAGLGGTKLIPIYGAKGHESEYIDLLTPPWMEMLAYTARLSRELGMTIDLGATSGWNMGGPWVRFEDAAKRVVLERFTLLGGQNLQEPVRHIQEPYTNLPEQPRQPIAANPQLHMENLYYVRYERELPLLSLMAYSGDGKIIDLTQQVGRDGRLDWTAPAGKWELYALFLGTGGKTVERACPGGVGWQIDYLSKEPVMRQMEQFEKAFSRAGYKMNDLIRSVHDDSFEQYTDWSGGLFETFKDLQGYDLRGVLPALFGDGPEDKVRRVKSDYRETVSERIIQEHMIPWTEWAHERGIQTLNQAAHGCPSHPLDNWAATDQPENTGANYLRHGGTARPDVFYMMASSAAHVSGKKITSQETATFMYGHFHNSLGAAKNYEIDKVFLNGSNKIYYHSTTYSPEDAPWPGWLYYAPVHFVPANPVWRDFSKLNSYVARVSSFLQSGKPDNDVLLYYPVYDAWYGMERWIGFPGPTDELLRSATALMDKGYTFDYVSDQQLMKTRFREGRLVTGGGSEYRAVVLPPCEFMPVETLQHLLRLANRGAVIVFSGGFPRDVPGFGRLRERREQFKKITEQLKNYNEGNNRRGKILIPGKNETGVLSPEAGIAPEAMAKEGLQFVRRTDEKGYIYFVKNTGDHAIGKFVPLSRDAASVAIFDPMREEAGMAASRKNPQGGMEVYLNLQPEETCILRTFSRIERELPEWKYVRELKGARLLHNWSLAFLEGGPVIPEGFASEDALPWTTGQGEEATWFAGTAEYSTTFQNPAKNRDAGEWILDLGEVYHSARVEVNGTLVATLITPPFKVNITDALRNGENKLKIEVTNLAANRIRYMEQKGIERPRFYNVDLSFGAYGRLGDPSNWPVMESGLAGPVRLIPAGRYHPLTGK